MFYFNTFLLFSVIGYAFEVIGNFLIHHTYRVTLLLGPWMPIYGFGLLISILIDAFLENKKLTGKKKLISFFFINIILLTILEAIGGYLIDWFFYTSYWNYETFPLHLGKYICVPISIFWGFGALFLHYILLPIFTPWIKKIPKWVSILLFFFLLIDNIYSILHAFHLF